MHSVQAVCRNRDMMKIGNGRNKYSISKKEKRERELPAAVVLRGVGSSFTA